jgi:hypothetical protein
MRRSVLDDLEDEDEDEEGIFGEAVAWALMGPKDA